MSKSTFRSFLRTFSPLILILSISNQALALPSYTVIDLGPPVEGFNSVEAWAINESGQVVGQTSDGIRINTAFYWDSANGIENIDIGGNGFVSINDNGQVVQFTSGTAGNIWDSTTGEVEAIPIAPKAINNSGLVVGYTAGSVAAVWDETNGTQTIGLGYSNDVNNDGRVVGETPNAYGQQTAYIWDNTSGLTLLPTLGTRAEANAINDFDHVVGQSRTLEDRTHAFIWDESNGISDLGTLDYNNSSRANEINNFDQVVGMSYTANFGEAANAMMWDSTYGMMDLNNLIPENTGWDLREAMGINDSGQIIVNGYYNGEDAWRSVLLDPVVKNGIVTTDQTFLSDYITLSDNFSFDYRWEMGFDPTDFNLDVLFFNGSGWETFGWLLNFDNISDEWLTASFSVPNWAHGESTQIMFSLWDFGQETDPTVYLRIIGSSSASAPAPVPEPSSVLLLGGGLAGLAWYVRKRKQL